MDRNQKFLNKLRQKERSKIDEVKGRIMRGDIIGLDIKKLKDTEDLFRVRVGRVRIIYSKKDGFPVEFILISFRDDNTYKHFRSLVL